MHKRSNEADPHRLLDEGELAARFGCSRKWAQARRLDGMGVPFLRLSGGLIRYRIADVEAFEQAALRGSTSDDGQPYQAKK